MPNHSQQPLHIETRHEDRLVLLGCDTCALSIQLRTVDPRFATDVADFFEFHARCSASIDLRD